uniref:tellurite resistance TerB family protein n=1 Tax=Paracoccus binzhouensis TaxID=2796149 RepID=UPI0018EF1141
GRGGILGGAAAGGLGGMLGDLLGGRGGQAQAQTPAQTTGQSQPGQPQGGLAQKDSQPQNDASFGELFNEALATGDEPATAPTPEQNALAGLMLKAMIQAAKSDGEIDEAEKAKLMDQFGELDDEERAFIREQMAAPVDAEALAREVPQGFGPQVYLMSLMAIEFDNRKEAEYLHTLAQHLGLDKETVNGIHQKIGVINLYA